MIVAVIADTHGNFRQLFNKYNQEIAKANLIIVLGDMYNAEIKLLDNFVQVPIIGVHGNHDDIHTYEHTKIYDIHNQIVELNNNITITGLQGSSKYKPSQIYGYTQEESKIVCSNLPICDILISHDGPFGYCSDTRDIAHSGLQGITDYINRAKPKIVFYGHHHKNRNFKIGNTDCYNVYELGIFDIEDRKVLGYMNYNLSL